MYLNWLLFLVLIYLIILGLPTKFEHNSKIMALSIKLPFKNSIIY